jgi:hypothetical protein
MQSTWGGKIVFIALVGGLCLADYGLRATLATAAPPVKEDQLAGVTQNWDKNLPSGSRFTVLSAFGGAAVRDNETGLVWAQSPALTVFGWKDARLHCPNRNIGGRKGWRLPSFPELASLIDPSNLNPTLPTGHPFSNVQADHYWSATALADEPTSAWLVDFSLGVGTGGKEVISGHAWCVRGPMNADAY